jgi:hypothetical protein
LQKALIKKAGFESQISELKEFAAKEKLEIVQPACLPTVRQAGRQVQKGGSLLRAGGRGVWGEFRPPYKFWAKSVRIFSNAHLP